MEERQINRNLIQLSPLKKLHSACWLIFPGHMFRFGLLTSRCCSIVLVHPNLWSPRLFGSVLKCFWFFRCWCYSLPIWPNNFDFDIVYHHIGPKNHTSHMTWFDYDREWRTERWGILNCDLATLNFHLHEALLNSCTTLICLLRQHFILKILSNTHRWAAVSRVLSSWVVLHKWEKNRSKESPVRSQSGSQQMVHQRGELWGKPSFSQFRHFSKHSQLKSSFSFWCIYILYIGSVKTVFGSSNNISTLIFRRNVLQKHVM